MGTSAHGRCAGGFSLEAGGGRWRAPWNSGSSASLLSALHTTPPKVIRGGKSVPSHTDQRSGMSDQSRGERGFLSSFFIWEPFMQYSTTFLP